MVKIKSKLFLDKNILSDMREDAKRWFPHEACGILGGMKNHAWKIIPVKNIAKNANRFRMDPQEQINAFLKLEKDGLDLVAIYHSHPNGLSIPSKIDINEAYYPETFHLIWSVDLGIWQVKAYKITQDGYSDIEIVLYDEVSKMKN